MVSMKSFTRDDGRVLQVVEGYREHVLGERPTYSTRTEWGADQYAAAAKKKLKRSQQFLKEFAHWGGHIEGARVIEVACGDGINSLLMALQPVESVIGIDLELPLVEQVERTERVRKLAARICAMADLEGDLDTVLDRLPLRFINMNATAMDFEDASFDFLMSRSAIEHIFPVEKALAEMARVVRPGGLLHLSTDPYFSHRGCHKTAVVDIPWAHARLSIDEYRRFVAESEGEAEAKKRSRRLETLNPYTIRQWQDEIEANGFEVLESEAVPSQLAQSLLETYSDVPETVLPGVEHRDLVNSRLRFWLRRKA